MHVKYLMQDLQDTERFRHVSCCYVFSGADSSSSLSLFLVLFSLLQEHFSGKSWGVIHIMTQWGTCSVLIWKHDSLGRSDPTNQGFLKNICLMSSNPILQLLMKSLADWGQEPGVSLVVQSKSKPQEVWQDIITMKRII